MSARVNRFGVALLVAGVLFFSSGSRLGYAQGAGGAGGGKGGGGQAGGAGGAGGAAGRGGAGG
ncbi:MAG: hypothetical protein NT069_33420, partial [Planctomycetota bacterium]|nr:hypothetical protein [Planctomycetota bacterium]